MSSSCWNSLISHGRLTQPLAPRCWSVIWRWRGVGLSAASNTPSVWGRRKTFHLSILDKTVVTQTQNTVHQACAVTQVKCTVLLYTHWWDTVCIGQIVRRPKDFKPYLQTMNSQSQRSSNHMNPVWTLLSEETFNIKPHTTIVRLPLGQTNIWSSLKQVVSKSSGCTN